MINFIMILLIVISRLFHLFPFPGEPIRVPLTIRQSEDFPVDLYIVMDVTYTMKNDLDNLKVLGAVIGNYH